MAFPDVSFESSFFLLLIFYVCYSFREYPVRAIGKMMDKIKGAVKKGGKGNSVEDSNSSPSPSSRSVRSAFEAVESLDSAYRRGSSSSNSSNDDDGEMQKGPAVISGGKGNKQKSNDELANYLRTHNHADIMDRLKYVQLGDMCKLKTEEGSKSRTVLNCILENATNGDDLIRRKLDSCVADSRKGSASKGTYALDENDPDYAITVDLNLLMDGNGGENQIGILKDMLDFKQDSLAARELLFHPVMETYLELKWKKVRRFFFFNFATYLLFLIAYSLFLGNIFYRKTRQNFIKITDLIGIIGGSNDQIVFPVTNEDGSTSDVVAQIDSDPNAQTINLAKALDGNTKHFGDTPYNRSLSDFGYCLVDGVPTVSCSMEIILLIMVVVLLAQEMVQCAALGVKRYLREFENLVELAALTLAAVGLFMQDQMALLKWLSAFGICLAYLELIFLMGRYPFIGGSVSLMFYSIMSHLAKSLSNFLVLIVGFAFGFFIINHGKDSDHFENPMKAFLKTLIMVLGEFEFDDLYNAHEGDPYSRVFAMVLLVALAVMGSLVLVNLIVALIVSDIADLRHQAHLQELVNKAQHIVYMESMIAYLCCCVGLKQRSSLACNAVVRVCPHSMCRCSGDKEKETKMFEDHVVTGLKDIIKTRKEKELKREQSEGEDSLRILLSNSEKRKALREFLHALS